MMGNRGCRGGDEWDAFSRRSRHLLHWRRGMLKKIKRRFSKRMRKAAKARLKDTAEATHWWRARSP